MPDKDANTKTYDNPLTNPITGLTPLDEINAKLGVEKDKGTRKRLEERKRALELEQGRVLASRQS